MSVPAGFAGSLIPKEGGTVKQQVGVFNAPPVYAVGLADALQGSPYAVATVTDVAAWIEHNPETIILIMVHEPGDLDLVVDLRSGAPETAVITVLDSVTVDAVAASLRAGATGSVGLYSSAEEVVLAIDAARSANVVMPAGIARSMMKTVLSGVDLRMLSEADIGCLHSLARGEKVADLASRSGYSEREMYRRLRRLYARMGVSGRTEALLLAARWGVID